jgi:hypothetical protein
MNRGSRVRTPAGDGTVHKIDQDTEWTFGKPHKRVWILVDLDQGGRKLFNSNDVDELDEIEFPE